MGDVVKTPRVGAGSLDAFVYPDDLSVAYVRFP